MSIEEKFQSTLSDKKLLIFFYIFYNYICLFRASPPHLSQNKSLDEPASKKWVFWFQLMNDVTHQWRAFHASANASASCDSDKKLTNGWVFWSLAHCFSRSWVVNFYRKVHLKKYETSITQYDYFYILYSIAYQYYFFGFYSFSFQRKASVINIY